MSDASGTSIRDAAPDARRVQDPTVLMGGGTSSGLSSFYVSFGGGMRLVGEDYMIQSLAPLGMGRRGFRKLCRQLGVPIIFAGKGACVDLFTFVSALKSVTRHGCRDFSLPGALERKKHLRRRVGPIDVEGVVAELVGGRAMFGMPTSAPLRTEISDACRRTTR